VPPVPILTACIKIHLVPNGRTVTTRKIDGLLGIGRFGPGNDYVYHGCVTGEFLDERVNQERTQFNFDETIIELIVRECSEHARQNAMAGEIVEFDSQRLGTMKDFVEEYPTFGFEEAEALLERTPKNAIKPEQFAQALIPIRIRRDKDRNEKVQRIITELGSDAGIPSDLVAAVQAAASEGSRGRAAPACRVRPAAQDRARCSCGPDPAHPRAG
jgi:hypothetical protein